MFVCFEGIDGAGKTTQARMLCQRLNKDGITATLVADPGTTSIGTAIRQILLHKARIQELMAANHVVICDRWLLSTLVYQGEINNVSIDLIVNIFRETSYVCPDICFLMDIAPENVRKRRPDGPADRYERRCIEDQHRMRAAYKTHAAHRPHASIVHHINADQDVEITHNEIYRLFSGVSRRRSVHT
ncbi:MAG: thymidylate kinase [Betaproteobacteria bacterium]|nr:thymidylate kinase [Betaproteobacteria bacterium]